MRTPSRSAWGSSSRMCCGVPAVRAVGLAAPEGAEAGTLLGIYAASVFRPESLSACPLCSREIPRKAVVEGEGP